MVSHVPCVGKRKKPIPGFEKSIVKQWLVREIQQEASRRARDGWKVQIALTSAGDLYFMAIYLFKALLDELIDINACARAGNARGQRGMLRAAYHGAANAVIAPIHSVESTIPVMLRIRGMC